MRRNRFLEITRRGGRGTEVVVDYRPATLPLSLGSRRKRPRKKRRRERGRRVD
jgi:hypothetical protein